MLIYVSTPKEETLGFTKLICLMIAKNGHVPIAPRLYLSQSMREDNNPPLEDLAGECDQMWVVAGGDQLDLDAAKEACLPTKHFHDLKALSDYVNKPSERKNWPNDRVMGLLKEVFGEKESKPPRSFDDLMKELTKVRFQDDEDNKLLVDYANSQAREIEKLTHIRRGTLEKILFLFHCMLSDMKKVEMTGEERKILIRGGVGAIADKLHVDERLVILALILDGEPAADNDEAVVKVISEYCKKQAPLVAKATGIDPALVEKILFLSNCKRFHEADGLSEEDFHTWLTQHFKEVAALSSQPEETVKRIFDAEMELVGRAEREGNQD